MSATSTARSRHCRQRKRAGLVRLVVEVDEDSLCQWLVAGGVLDPLHTDRPDKIAQALERAIALVMAGNNQRG